MLGYQLQFLQPLGYLRNYQDIPESMKYIIHQRFGINEGEDSLKIIMEQGDIIREDIKTIMNLATEFTLAQENLKENFTPAQLKSIHQYFNNGPTFNKA
jgi:hypothetical protein